MNEELKPELYNDQDLLEFIHEQDKRSPLNRFLESIIRKVMTPEKVFESSAALIMTMLEIIHDQMLFPEKYFLPESIKYEPTNKFLEFAWQNIGDIWEISVLFLIFRLIIFHIPELVFKYGFKKKYSEEVFFWLSIATTCIIQGSHSLGYIDYFGHSHYGNPAVGMLFGQVVAALVLATTHMTVQRREGVKDVASRIYGKIRDTFIGLGDRKDRFLDEVFGEKPANLDN